MSAASRWIAAPSSSCSAAASSSASASGRGALLAQERRRGYPTDFNVVSAHRRGRPRHRLLRQDRDGPGRPDLAGADGGRGAGRRARVDRHGPRRHRPLPVGHGHVRLAHDAHVRAGAARRRRGGARACCSCSRPSGSACPKEKLVVENGVVSVKGDPRRQVTYGELAKGQTITRTLDEKAVLRSVSEFKVMGQSPEAARRPGQGDRRREVRGRHPSARYALRAGSCVLRRTARSSQGRHLGGREDQRRHGRQPRRPRRGAARRSRDRGRGARRGQGEWTPAPPVRTRTASSTSCWPRRRRPP